MVYISNAFSLQMLEKPFARICAQQIDKEHFEYMKSVGTSVVGHEELAKKLGVACNRQAIKLSDGDCLVVAQVTTGRPSLDGTVDMSQIVFYEIRIYYSCCGINYDYCNKETR